MMKNEKITLVTTTVPLKKPEHDEDSRWGIHQKKMADNHVEKTTG